MFEHALVLTWVSSHTSIPNFLYSNHKFDHNLILLWLNVLSNLCPQIHSDLFSGSGHDIFCKFFACSFDEAKLKLELLYFFVVVVVFCFLFQVQPTNSMGSELFEDNSKLHGHTGQ